MSNLDIVVMLFSNIFIAIGLAACIYSLAVRENFLRYAFIALGTISYGTAVGLVIYLYPEVQKAMAITNYP